MKIFCINKSTSKLLLLMVLIFIIDFYFIYIKCCNIEYSQYDLSLIEKYNDKKILALTFDDGPSKYTPLLLDILENENVKATFFVLGQKVIGNEDTIVKEYNNGHTIGIHSYEHVFFTKISKEEINEQISKTNDILCTITNTEPTYIRVPYGIINNEVKSVLKSYNLENILWTVDSLDWNYKNTQKTIAHVIDTTEGNDIILMHDTYKTTIDAVKELIKYYKEKGYIFVTINEFYRIKNMAKSTS